MSRPSVDERTDGNAGARTSERPHGDLVAGRGKNRELVVTRWHRVARAGRRGHVVEDVRLHVGRQIADLVSVGGEGWRRARSHHGHLGRSQIADRNVVGSVDIRQG